MSSATRFITTWTVGTLIGIGVGYYLYHGNPNWSIWFGWLESFK